MAATVSQLAIFVDVCPVDFVLDGCGSTSGFLDRDQIVIGVQLRYAAETGSLFDRPPKLNGRKIEFQMFGWKTTV